MTTTRPDPVELSAPGDIVLQPGRGISRTAARRRAPVSWPKVALAVADLVAVAIGVAVASQIAGLSSSGWAVAIATLPVWPVILAYQLLYRERFIVRGADEGSRVVKAVLSGVVGVALTGLLAEVDIPRPWYPIAAASVLVTLGAERLVARHLFKRARRLRHSLRRVVIIGANAEGRFVRSMIDSDPDLGYEVVGFLEDFLDAPPGADFPRLSRSEDALAIVQELGVSGVIIATTAIDVGASNRIIRLMTDNGIHVEMSSSLCDIAAERLTVRPLGRLPMMYIEPRERRGWRARAKRSFDLVVASVLLVVLSPVLLVAMVAVRATSPGPVLFRQERVGRDGVTFPVLKLRTMVANAEDLLDDLRHLNEATGPLFKIADDPRITRVGRILRKTSIDELPQLWNVIRGEMSLVGPRPALPSEVAQWDPSLHNRLRVQPGITGMWQVQGRSSSSEGDYAQLDLYYVDNWTLVADIVILLRTVPAVLSQRGAM